MTLFDDTGNYHHTPGDPMNWEDYALMWNPLPQKPAGVGQYTIEELVKELCKRDRAAVREQIRLAELDIDCE